MTRGFRVYGLTRGSESIVLNHHHCHVNAAILQLRDSIVRRIRNEAEGTRRCHVTANQAQCPTRATCLRMFTPTAAKLKPSTKNRSKFLGHDLVIPKPIEAFFMVIRLKAILTVR